MLYWNLKVLIWKKFDLESIGKEEEMLRKRYNLQPRYSLIFLPSHDRALLSAV